MISLRQTLIELFLHLLTFQMPIIYDNSAEGRIIDI